MSKRGKQENKLILFTLLVTMITTAAGCVKIPTIGSENKGNEACVSSVETMGIKNNGRYEYSEQKPHIAVSAMGYSAEDHKYFYSFGDMADEFYVINTVDNETVMEGSISEIGTDSEGRRQNYGDFSQLGTPGTYVIYNETVGYSYPFRIENNLWSELYNHVYHELEEAKAGNSSQECYRLSMMLLSKELYPDMKADDAYIMKTAQRLLASDKIDDLYITAVMAQIYNAYAAENPELAGSCLERAVAGYDAAVKEDGDGTVLYLAGSALYRATGNPKYVNSVMQADDVSERSDEEYRFLADMAYLMCEKRTDYNRCELLMNGYLKQAADISQSWTKDMYYMDSDIKNMKEDDVMEKMLVLGMADYVLSCNEYLAVVKHCLNYYSGINPWLTDTNIGLYENAENGEAMPDIEVLAKTLFVLCHAADVQTQ